jgi:hypothetical protein
VYFCIANQCSLGFAPPAPPTRRHIVIERGEHGHLVALIAVAEVLAVAGATTCIETMEAARNRSRSSSCTSPPAYDR